MQIDRLINDSYVLILDRDLHQTNRSLAAGYRSANLWVELETKMNFAYFKHYHNLTESETVDVALALLKKIVEEDKVSIQINEINKKEMPKLL